MYFMLKMNEVSFKKDDELADFKVDNSLLRDSADLQIVEMKQVYAVSSINEAVNHLFVVGPLEHQEDSRNKESSRIVEKRKLENDASYFI